MAEVGALHEARLGEGQEGSIQLDLASGCTTVVAVGSASIVDLDAALTDAAGTRLARGTGHTSEATIRSCHDAAGTFTLKLKAVHGAGSVLVSTWSGAAPVDPSAASRGHEGSSTFGTCEAPIPLSAGEFSGTTVHAEHLNESKGCGSNAQGAELVYRLDLTSRQKVLMGVETSGFDAVTYVRKGDCGDQDAEVACNDDAPAPGRTDNDTKFSRIEQVFDPGVYFLFVDGININARGSFKLTVEMSDVPPLSELCGNAPPLADGVPVSGSTDGAVDNVGSTCGDGAHGPDSVFRLALARRSRVRAVMHSDDYAPVVHVRSRCEDEQSSVGCADQGGADHEATFLGLLDPGSYAVFADSSQREANGKFTLTAETAPEGGSGVVGERCGDAIQLVKGEATREGDTFAAKDDVASQCGGAGAPDQVYRLDVPARAHFTAHITREEGTHVLSLLRGCTGPHVEIECGKTIDRLLPPGTYFLAVDGDSPTSFGRYTLEWFTHDTRAQEAACRAPPRLREGEPVTGSTLGAVDKFSPTCAASDSSASGAPDVVYQLVLTARRRVHIRLRTAGWAGVLVVRRSCADGDAGATAGNEVACQTEDSNDAEFEGVLAPGTYFAVVDGREPSSAGSFTLDYTVTR
jgi:hypothetical protein